MNKIKVAFEGYKQIEIILMLGITAIYTLGFLYMIFFLEFKNKFGLATAMGAFLLLFIILLIAERARIKSLFFTGTVIESKEDGLQLSFLYNIFIPWEDLESVKTLIKFRGDKYLVLRVKNPLQYAAKTQEGVLRENMQSNIKAHLTPFVLYANVFPIAAETLEDLINKEIENYKALEAANKS